MSVSNSLTNSSARRNRERGSVLVVAMIALVALATLGGLTVVTVRSSLSGTTHDQFKAVALSAAEAGIAVGIDHARRTLQPGLLWSNEVFPNNILPEALPAMAGNGVKPGLPGNIFSPDANAWYEVVILNNVDDGPSITEFGATAYTGHRDGIDTDGRIIIRSIGHGPNNASARIDVEIQSPTVMGAACNSGLANNDGAGCGQVQSPDPPTSTPF
jgi:Tfp pilus assembly protein PilX